MLFRGMKRHGPIHVGLDHRWTRVTVSLGSMASAAFMLHLALL